MLRPCHLTFVPEPTLAPRFLLLLVALLPGSGRAAAASPAPVSSAPPRLEALGGSLRFEANRGQADPAVRFIAQGPGYAVALAPEGVTLTLAGSPSSPGASDRARLQVRFLGSHSRPAVEGQGELATRVHYYQGRGPEDWKTGVPTYERVHYDGVYPGIDVLFYGKEGELEYDLVVAPGADPGLAQLSVEGAHRLELEETSGDLLLHVGAQVVRMKKPFVYQEREGRREEVVAEYVLVPHDSPVSRRVAFKLGAHDPGRPLVIDPVLVYSTYVLGAAGESAHFLARSASDGSVALIGQASLSWPYIPPPGYGGNIDAWVARLDASGAPVYFAYLGGSDYEADATGALDAEGNLVVVGTTASRNFPVQNAIQPQNGYLGQWATTDAFVTKFDPSGALVYSTYLGGRWGDAASRVVVDAGGHAYLCGYTSSLEFPTTPDAIQPTLPGPENGGDAFLTRLGPTGALVYSTFVGGDRGESCGGLALDASGNVYLGGTTSSLNGFPILNPLPGSSLGAQDSDAFVTKLDLTAVPPTLLYSTRLGGPAQEFLAGLAVDAAGSVIAVGLTEGPGFPLVNPAQPYRGLSDAFAAKIGFDSATGTTSLVYSTPLGGTGREYMSRDGVAVDALGNAHVVGATDSTNFPTRNAAQPGFGGVHDGFVVKLDATGNEIYATYLGGGGQEVILGVEADARGNAHVVGAAYPYWPDVASTSPYPQVDPVQTVSVASQNGFITKLNRAGGILHSSYLGGTHSDAAVGLALDDAGNAYVSGVTLSSDFPTTNAAQATLTGQSDGFVVKIEDPNRAPGAGVGQPLYDVDEGSSAGLTATGVDPEAGPLVYAWDLDGDSVFETSGASASFDAGDLDGPDTRRVVVQVTDEEGASTTAETTVAIRNVAPEAPFTVSPPAPLVGECVTLSLSGASDPAPADQASLLYSFDCAQDGFDQVGAATTHVCSYPAVGPVTVQGQVADDDGGSSDLYTAAFTVTLPQAALQESVVDVIDDLVAAGYLTPAQANAALALANAAIRQLEGGNLNGAIGAVGALGVVIGNLVDRGLIPPEVGAELLADLNQILLVLERWQSGGTCP
jgi:hypothetical protein